jgi:hypothetical protein
MWPDDQVRDHFAAAKARVDRAPDLRQPSQHTPGGDVDDHDAYASSVEAELAFQVGNDGA